MNVKYKYWYFQEAIPGRICDEIVTYGNTLREEIAITGNQLSVQDNLQRDSHIAWTSDRWIYNEIQPYVQEANKNANWNFEYHWSEPIQFTKYKLNQHYDWHRDSWDDPYDKPDRKELNGLIRKLSVIVSLSNREDYKGGVLQLDFKDGRHGENNIIDCTQLLSKGSIIVFPSFMWHRVTPVTSGLRYSLVNWNCGDPWV